MDPAASVVRRARRAILLSGLAAGLGFTAACHTLAPVGLAQLNSKERPPRVWVTRADSSVIIMHDPQLRGDTINGLLYGEPEDIRLAEAVAIRAPRSAPVRTAVLAIAVGVAAGEWLWRMEHRDDVGDAQQCTSSFLDMGGNLGPPFVPCCQFTGTQPC